MAGPSVRIGTFLGKTEEMLVGQIYNRFCIPLCVPPFGIFTPTPCIVQELLNVAGIGRFAQHAHGDLEISGSLAVKALPVQRVSQASRIRQIPIWRVRVCDVIGCDHHLPDALAETDDGILVAECGNMFPNPFTKRWRPLPHPRYHNERYDIEHSSHW